MSSKYCDKCQRKVTMDIMECPDCHATSFVHKNPARAELASELAGYQQEQIKITSPKELAIIMQQKENAMDPIKLDLFRRRLHGELDELEYLEWRSHQPGWTDPEVQQRWKNITATAAGVAVGTSLLRSQLGNINNTLSGDNSSDAGGIADWLGDIFS